MGESKYESFVGARAQRDEGDAQREAQKLTGFGHDPQRNEERRGGRRRMIEGRALLNESRQPHGHCRRADPRPRESRLERGGRPVETEGEE